MHCTKLHEYTVHVAKAVTNHGKAKLELCDLVVNIHNFMQLLSHIHFKVKVDQKDIENLKKYKKQKPPLKCWARPLILNSNQMVKRNHGH